MKKILLVALAILMCVMCMGAYLPPEEETGFTYAPFVQQETLHEMAELARSIGLPEDDPIIVRAQELWWEAQERFCEDRDAVATLLGNEAGYGCSDRHMELVAVVPVNRCRSDKFPDTIYEVIVQKNQYHPDYADPNSYYGRRARADAESWAKYQEIAARALRGEIDCDTNVLYQAEFVQGTGVYETHKTSYSTTYFCFG